MYTVYRKCYIFRIFVFTLCGSSVHCLETGIVHSTQRVSHRVPRSIVRRTHELWRTVELHEKCHTRYMESITQRVQKVSHNGHRMYHTHYTANICLSIPKDFWTLQNKGNNRNRDTDVKSSVGIPNSTRPNLIFCLHFVGLQDNISF